MVNWTADKDQIILKGIFEFHDIKSTGPLLDYLANKIGGDCSAKAVSHRLAKLRNGGTARANNGSSGSHTPKATPRSRAKSTPRKKKQVSEEFDSDGPSGPVDDDEVLSPTAARGKRGLNGMAKPNYDEGSGDEDERDDMEEEYVPLAKRVKAEPVEDGEILGDELVEEEI
ncbi:hypothetical protein B0T12DRAFT_397741 [Alternaria alternata]|nr:hypothetical protein B0T12DRAFT_397741 [Alternaria alternata]